MELKVSKDDDFEAELMQRIDDLVDVGGQSTPEGDVSLKSSATDLKADARASEQNELDPLGVTGQAGHDIFPQRGDWQHEGL